MKPENREPGTEIRKESVLNREPIKRFEDIVAWRLARVLARDVYALTSVPSVSRDFGFVSQIQRAAVSVMNNIAEGYERKGQGEFAHFLLIAKASVAEVRSMAYLGSDIGFFTHEALEKLLRQTDEISRVISGFRSSILQNNRSVPENLDTLKGRN